MYEASTISTLWFSYVACRFCSLLRCIFQENDGITPQITPLFKLVNSQQNALVDIRSRLSNLFVYIQDSPTI